MRHFKKGRVKTASLFDVPSGKTLLIHQSLRKLHIEPEKGKRLGINEGIEKGRAYLPLDEEWISLIRREQVAWLAYQIRQQNILYVIEAAAVFDPKRYITRPRNKQGAFWRCLPMDQFTVKHR